MNTVQYCHGLSFYLVDSHNITHQGCVHGLITYLDDPCCRTLDSAMGICIGGFDWTYQYDSAGGIGTNWTIDLMFVFIMGVDF